MPGHSLLPRFVAPAGARVPWGRTLTALLRPGLGDQALDIFAERFQVRHAWGFSSGRAALCAALKTLHRMRPERDVVAIPAYTCFTVPASIVRAGLKVLPVDIDPATLDLDYAHLESVAGGKLLAIANSNLFGYPADAARAKVVAQKAGAFFIDDAAQALGATHDGRFAGTRGDLGLYSLGRGKALPVAHGGVLVSDSDEIAKEIKTEMERIPGGGLLRTGRLALEIVATSVLLRPHLYWLPNSIPMLKLGITEFDTDFAVEALPRFSRALLRLLLERLDELNALRKQTALAILERVEKSGFRRVQAAPGASPTYVRLPLLAEDEQSRDAALAALRAAGIGASGAYPSAICEISELGSSLAEGWRHCPQAECVARRLLTLPTHAYVATDDVAAMAECLAEVGTPRARTCTVC